VHWCLTHCRQLVCSELSTSAQRATVEHEQLIGQARHENCDIHTLTWPDLPVDGRARLSGVSLLIYTRITHSRQCCNLYTLFVCVVEYARHTHTEIEYVVLPRVLQYYTLVVFTTGVYSIQSIHWNIQYTVYSHSRSPILVPIERSYTTSY